MNIHTRYFASLREITGRNEEQLTIEANTTIADLRALLCQRYPPLETALQRATSAVNRRYVTSETTLHEGDEVVFIPPVGGGYQ